MPRWRNSRPARAFPIRATPPGFSRPTNDVKGDSGLEKLAGQARKYLNRVVAEHPDTPWADRHARIGPLRWAGTLR